MTFAKRINYDANNDSKIDSGAIETGAFVSSASNQGTGQGTLFIQNTSGDLEFKTLNAGSGVTITNNADNVTIDATGGGGGEANNGTNLGAGSQVFAQKNGVNLEFRTLTAGTDISLTQSADTIEIAYVAGGGGVVNDPVYDGVTQVYNASDDGNASLPTGDDLTKSGDPTISVTSGTSLPSNLTKMIVFDGTGDRYSTTTLTSKTTFAENEDFTAIVWVRPDVISGSDTFLFSIYNGANRNWGLAIDDTGVYKATVGNGGSGTNLNTPTSAVVGTWAMVAIQRDSVADTARVSVNGSGSTFGLSSFTIGIPGSPTLELGGLSSGTLFQGAIAMAALWDRNLSNTEINDLYNSGAGLKYNTSGVIGDVLSATTVNLDVSTTKQYEIIMSSNITTLNLTGGSGGDRIMLYFIQDSGGGNTVGFASNINGASAINTTANALTILEIQIYSGAYYVISQNSFT